ncbi:Protein of unknown function [Propionibacterium freudenreichii subsp. freudenreichii]|uniref:Uncharacterized protein n=1 Tax=Propionibacterium freudenreichii subsp. freudenreichii TaxID=66712 RepID=A0A0B7NZK8_PROFF|nr:Protein of unknown function [Propionibacterium freudenreichii]CEP26864.1 Protein of unknown function [Propionibacterium freudenreichii subsp. freudenreichii]CEG97768.1 Protein of unknown function [Propionibacterium freudenreichii]CEH05468.1 Protein of unknown function [Propionibacterium freudenreichii]CEH06561.1 Protein of unknown function [Propionibacterium freudenreichii]
MRVRAALNTRVRWTT